MTPAQRHLASRVVGVLRRDVGRRDIELAERLDVTLAELRPVLAALYRRRRVDACWGWTVTPPARRAA